MNNSTRRYECHTIVSKSLRRVSLVQRTRRQARCLLRLLLSTGLVLDSIYPLGKFIILVIGESPTTIMNSENATLPLLRNIEWRTVTTERNKINQVLPNISTNNITELNELIYGEAKLVSEKIGIPQKSRKKI